ncbi:hypothetical protein NEILACOT_05506 [Neisseria lactamica ATCC 23970]|uniref:Uncharacterized protein n=2 Tax=Neisseria lactamica TaxID=486 RepID=D0WD70_NEILA|nr:hypothetical protein B2G52_02355 [Neisseria lactamica]EEZ74468.1 hypothetical protein NEILACOT_05506 [Neisseria lactamica ATCC 23970]
MPSFPRRRESRSVGIGTYRIKRFIQPCVLDSHFRGNDGMRVSVRTCSDSRLRGNDDSDIPDRVDSQGVV